MHKSLITTVLAVAALTSTGCATSTYDGGRDYSSPQYRGCYPGERGGDCRERLRYEQQSNQRYVWRNDHYEARDTTGAAIAGGILGFVLGTVVAGSNSDRDYYNGHRNDRGWRERCSTSHPGFDARNGTYVGQDGYRHYCTR